MAKKRKRTRLTDSESWFAWMTDHVPPSDAAMRWAGSKSGRAPGYGPARRRRVSGAKKKKLRQNPDWITASAVRIRKAGRKLMLDILR